MKSQELLFEVFGLCAFSSHTDVATRVQAPALCLHLRKLRHFTQPRHISVGPGRKCFLQALAAPARRFDGVAPVQSDDIRQKLDLLGLEVTMAAVDPMREVACVDEEDTILAVSSPLGLIEKPERAGDRGC